MALLRVKFAVMNSNHILQLEAWTQWYPTILVFVGRLLFPLHIPRIIERWCDLPLSSSLSQLVLLLCYSRLRRNEYMSTNAVTSDSGNGAGIVGNMAETIKSRLSAAAAA